MAKMNIKNDGKRVLFPKGEQASFLRKQLEMIAVTQRDLAMLLSIHPRSLSDWLREKNLMPLSALEKICDLSQTPLPRAIITRDKYWYTKIGAPLGAHALHKKYGSSIGNTAHQKSQWKKWWKKIGKFKNKTIGSYKSFKIPRYSKKLAEFTGIMLGDGGIQPYQMKITLNADSDKNYVVYVSNLLQELFDVQPKIYRRKGSKAVDICISRVKLTSYLIHTVGLKKGNKLRAGIEIPPWITKNPRYAIACVRGLIDTDGCIIQETHKKRGKKYIYARLNFVSGSPLLVRSVYNILLSLNLEPRLRKRGYAVQIENKEKIWQYLKTIGTSNKKHLDRWRNITETSR